MALSGGDDKVVKLWDLRTKQNMAEYYESTGQINAVRFHPSGNCVAAAGDDHSTRIWDIRTHKLLQHYSVSHQESVNGSSIYVLGSLIKYDRVLHRNLIDKFRYIQHQ